MGEWKAIRMTQARQVVEMMDGEEQSLAVADVDVRTYYDGLKATAPDDALDFIAHALPRQEAVAWAAHLLDRESRHRVLSARDRQALDCALRWVGEPDDPNRRAAHDAAQRAGERSPERLLGLAVYLSGGSLSGPDLPPVLPAPEACGRMAASAIKMAGYRSGDADTVIGDALSLAERIAQRGISAIDTE